MTRQANIGWLVETFAAQGLRLIKRLPEQFSEAYTKLGPPLDRPVHAINRLWLRHIRSPLLAADNILVLEKQSG